MKLDPGIHIVMHSVFSLKPGVTLDQLERAREKKKDGEVADKKVNCK